MRRLFLKFSSLEVWHGSEFCGHYSIVHDLITGGFAANHMAMGDGSTHRR